MSIYKDLLDYSKKDIYPMHMPGHKRNVLISQMENPYLFDVTEVEGTDDLHHPGGMIQESMKRAARLFGAEETLYLINGSTAGLLIAISACCKKGGSILVARNCHKSVYNAVFLNECNPVYLYPEIDMQYGIQGGITKEQVENKLSENPDIQCVVITSPTYEGVVSDIKAISSVVHKYGIPVIVDEAHGAHLGFHPYFPVSSNQSGADIVVQSVHKTLPALTQTALLHINGTIVNRDVIMRYFSVFQSSSPSYVLMSSIDQCVNFLINNKDSAFDRFTKKLEQFDIGANDLKYLKVYKGDDTLFRKEPSKIVISTMFSNINGKELYEILLDKYRIQVEMAEEQHIVAMTSICDTAEGFARLLEALHEIDQNCFHAQKKPFQDSSAVILKTVMSSYDAYDSKGEMIALHNSTGRVSKEYIYIYPPGIPLIVPGEEITKDFIRLLAEYSKLGFKVKGCKYENAAYIEVVKGGMD